MKCKNGCKDKMKFLKEDELRLPGGEVKIFNFYECGECGQQNHKEKTEPTKDEIQQEMELHNADEVGIDNQWTLEDAEYHLLLSDKYYKPEPYKEKDGAK